MHIQKSWEEEWRRAQRWEESQRLKTREIVIERVDKDVNDVFFSGDENDQEEQYYDKEISYSPKFWAICIWLSWIYYSKDVFVDTSNFSLQIFWQIMVARVAYKMGTGEIILGNNHIPSM